ncbi:MAG: tetratricopeptide repeat protein [Bacteroidetes bacterium]|nr:tetratricopeptide repeat protein [Bacteroidota bacterium]
MYKLIFTIIIGLTVQFAQAQENLNENMNTATVYLQSGNYQKAVNEYSYILTKATDNQLRKFCFIYRAFSYNGLHDYKNAIADLDKAIELDPNDIASYTDRGKTKAEAADMDGAKKDFLYILSKESTGEQAEAALYYLGRIAYTEKQFQESIKYYDKFLALVPNDAEGYFDRAAAKGLMMDLAGSIKDYDKAIEIDPNFMEAYANRGIAKINMQTKNGNTQPTKYQTRDACADLRKAKKMGDSSVDDMLYIYCNEN